MAEPITVPVETDPEELVEIGRDVFRAAFPGWDPSRGDQVDWLLRACAYIIAEARDTASEVPTSIFRYLGRWLVGLSAIGEESAEVTATVTAVDSLGYTVPAGTRFRAKTTGDGGVVFTSILDVVIPPGSSATADGEVQLVADVPGSGGNFDPGIVGEPLDSIPWITGVAFEDSGGSPVGASGGLDGETDDEYLERFARELQILTPAPILPGDIPPLVRRVPGVGRCLAINLYDPGTGTYDNEKTVTVVVMNDSGGPTSAPLKTAVENLLELS